METTELVYILGLVVLLLALAGYYGWRQLQTLRRVNAAPERFSRDEEMYLRRRAWRRLAGSALMLLLAGQLAGSFAIESWVRELHEAREANREKPPDEIFTPAQKRLGQLYYGYWIVFLFNLMAVLMLAAADFLATRRFGRRAHQKILDDRRMMLERQMARLRQEGNGHDG